VTYQSTKAPFYFEMSLAIMPSVIGCGVNVKIWQGAVSFHKSCLTAPCQILSLMAISIYVEFYA
jgi:hypothetical protein